MVKTNPKVSVIIPCYNREATLPRTLDSVIDQSYGNIEVIIVDDGSTDASPAVIDDYVSRYPDRFRVIRTSNGGPYAARNLALDNATGEFIAFLDSDDYWAGGKIEKQVKLYEENEELGLQHTAVTQIDGAGNVYKHSVLGEGFSGNCFRKLLVRNGIATSSVMVPKFVFDKVGNFNEKYRARGDWEMWTRISRAYPIYYIEEELTYYRVHPGMMSTNHPRMKMFHLMIVEDNRALYKGEIDDIDKLADEAALCCHLSYAKGAVTRGDFLFSAECFFKAIAIRPFKIDIYFRAMHGMLKAAVKQVFFARN